MKPNNPFTNPPAPGTPGWGKFEYNIDYNIPEYAKTYTAVEDYLSTHPKATVHEIIRHLISLNIGVNNKEFTDSFKDITTLKHMFITNIRTINTMMKEIQNNTSEPSVKQKGVQGIDGPTGPTDKTLASVEKTKADRIRAFMGMSRKGRDAYISRNKIDLDTPENERDSDEEDSPDVSQYLKGMKRNREEDEDN